MRTRVAIVAILLALIASPTLAHHRPNHKPRPTPTATPSPTPTPTLAPTPTPTLAPTPTPTPTASPTPTLVPTPTASPTPTVPLPPTLDCSGYPEPRTFTEAQSWWTQTPGQSGTDFGHLHVGACMPYKQQVAGVIALDVRLILHNNPGQFAYLNPVLKTDSQELSLPKTYLDWTCAGTCERWVTLSVDTRLSDSDGVQEIRIRTFVDEPDGNRMHASVNTLVNVQNGDPENPIDRRAYQRFKGWYTGSGYCEPDILTDLPMAPVTSWSPTVQAVHHGASDDLPVSRYVVALDANAHEGIPGTILAQGDGELAPTTLNISGLAPGQHRLSIRAECDDPRGSTNSGVGVVIFTVP